MKFAIFLPILLAWMPISASPIGENEEKKEVFLMVKPDFSMKDSMLQKNKDDTIQKETFIRDAVPETGFNKSRGVDKFVYLHDMLLNLISNSDNGTAADNKSSGDFIFMDINDGNVSKETKNLMKSKGQQPDEFESTRKQSEDKPESPGKYSDHVLESKEKHQGILESNEKKSEKFESKRTYPKMFQSEEKLDLKDKHPEEFKSLEEYSNEFELEEKQLEEFKYLVKYFNEFGLKEKQPEKFESKKYFEEFETQRDRPELFESKDKLSDILGLQRKYPEEFLEFEWKGKYPDSYDLKEKHPKKAEYENDSDPLNLKKKHPTEFESNDKQVDEFEAKRKPQDKFEAKGNHADVLDLNKNHPEEFVLKEKLSDEFELKEKQPGEFGAYNMQTKNFEPEKFEIFERREKHPVTSPKSKEKQPETFQSYRKYSDVSELKEKYPDDFDLNKKQPEEFESEGRHSENFESEGKNFDKYEITEKYPEEFKNVGWEGKHPDVFEPEEKHPDGFESKEKNPDEFESNETFFDAFVLNGYRNPISTLNNTREVEGDGEVHEYIYSYLFLIPFINGNGTNILENSFHSKKKQSNIDNEINTQLKHSFPLKEDRNKYSSNEPEVPNEYEYKISTSNEYMPSNKTENQKVGIQKYELLKEINRRDENIQANNSYTERTSDKHEGKEHIYDQKISYKSVRKAEQLSNSEIGRITDMNEKYYFDSTLVRNYSDLTEGKSTNGTEFDPSIGESVRVQIHNSGNAKEKLLKKRDANLMSGRGIPSYSTILGPHLITENPKIESIHRSSNQKVTEKVQTPETVENHELEHNLSSTSLLEINQSEGNTNEKTNHAEQFEKTTAQSQLVHEDKSNKSNIAYKTELTSDDGHSLAEEISDTDASKREKFKDEMHNETTTKQTIQGNFTIEKESLIISVWGSADNQRELEHNSRSTNLHEINPYSFNNTNLHQGSQLEESTKNEIKYRDHYGMVTQEIKEVSEENGNETNPANKTLSASNDKHPLGEEKSIVAGAPGNESEDIKDRYYEVETDHTIHDHSSEECDTEISNTKEVESLKVPQQNEEITTKQISVDSKKETDETGTADQALLSSSGAYSRSETKKVAAGDSEQTTSMNIEFRHLEITSEEIRMINDDGTAHTQSSFEEKNAEATTNHVVRHRKHNDITTDQKQTNNGSNTEGKYTTNYIVSNDTNDQTLNNGNISVTHKSVVIASPSIKNQEHEMMTGQTKTMVESRGDTENFNQRSVSNIETTNSKEGTNLEIKYRQQNETITKEAKEFGDNFPDETYAANGTIFKNGTDHKSSNENFFAVSNSKETTNTEIKQQITETTTEQQEIPIRQALEKQSSFPHIFRG